VFCQKVEDKDYLIENETAVSFLDSYPLTEGHTLIIPKRHISEIFNLDSKEYTDIWEIINATNKSLTDTLSPDGFNIGVNVGKEAGQTIDHAHLHLIPRYKGDIADPRGGIRWIIPDKAPYWE
tara:strand:+ start:850 stop:1218 length:369 start_codon:yes stop_codon:yes gene_type:complete